jgi:Uma2 family endonuclease
VTSVQTPTPARFNVEQFMRICEAGVFDENLRVELVEGEVLSVPPPGPEHSFGVNRLTALIHEWRITLPAGEPRPTVSIHSSVVFSEPAASSYAISRSLVPDELVAPAAFPSLRLAWWGGPPLANALSRDRAKDLTRWHTKLRVCCSAQFR